MLRRTSEWGLLDHCDRPLHPTQQDHEGGCTTQQTSYKLIVRLPTHGESVDTYSSVGLWCTQSCSELHTQRTHTTSTQWLCVPPLQVYCDMDLDGGGWTMVWKHSYMEVLPLTTAMYYFSQHYRECSDMEAGWCNIPNKGHLQPTHMMIAAYHNKNVVWAYKGWFNWNIDRDWTGGVLVEPVQVVDNCPRTDWSVGKPPAPSTAYQDRRLLGIAFDKSTPNNYLKNCDTVKVQFTNPGDCRFHDCALGTRNPIVNNQMTVVIYIR